MIITRRCKPHGSRWQFGIRTAKDMRQLRAGGWKWVAAIIAVSDQPQIIVGKCIIALRCRHNPRRGARVEGRRNLCINRDRSASRIRQNLDIAGKIAGVRDEDTSRNIKTSHSRLFNNNLAAILLGKSDAAAAKKRLASARGQTEMQTSIVSNGAAAVTAKAHAAIGLEIKGKSVEIHQRGGNSRVVFCKLIIRCNCLAIVLDY